MSWPRSISRSRAPSSSARGGDLGAQFADELFERGTSVGEAGDVIEDIGVCHSSEEMRGGRVARCMVRFYNQTRSAWFDSTKNIILAADKRRCTPIKKANR